MHPLGGSGRHKRKFRTGRWRPNATNVPSGQAWYRPDGISGTNLATWPDLSPNAYDISVASGPGPVVVANALGPYPAIHFTTSLSNHLRATNIPRLHGVDATIYLILKFPQAVAGKMIGQGSWNTETVSIYPSHNGDVITDLGNGTNGSGRLRFASSIFSGPNYHIMTIRRTSTGGEVWHNGTSIHTGVLNATMPTDSATLTIGTFNGYIAEFIVCTAALDTATRQKIEGYLAHKFSLDANLPSGHPYKTAAP